mgnify:CR=1 FL=1
MPRPSRLADTLPDSAASVSGSLHILPAVWMASVLSVAAGLLAAKLFGRLWKRREGR